jgi:hypothetical protein
VNEQIAVFIILCAFALIVALMIDCADYKQEEARKDAHVRAF